MRVILLQDVPGTGRKGEVKDVASGYARNFLLPRNFGKLATEAALRELEAQAAKLKKRMEEELKKSQQLASQLDGKEVEVKEKVSKTGRLYAGVDGKKIATAVENQLKATIEPKQVRLKAAIKEVGEHRIVIEFGHGLEAELTVQVSAK